jgi:hypothetical protein
MIAILLACHRGQPASCGPGGRRRWHHHSDPLTARCERRISTVRHFNLSAQTHQRGSMMQVSRPATERPSSSTPATVICPSRAGFCRHASQSALSHRLRCSEVHWPAPCQQRVSVYVSNSSSPSLPCRVASASGVHTCLLRGVLVATSAGTSAGTAASAAGACAACGIAADMLPHAATGAWGRRCWAMYWWLETRLFLKPRFS